jgi:hypothetical protein
VEWVGRDGSGTRCPLQLVRLGIEVSSLRLSFKNPYNPKPSINNSRSCINQFFKTVKNGQVQNQNAPNSTVACHRIFSHSPDEL